MEISKIQQKAAEQLISIIANGVGQNKVVNLPTAISTAARLSGSFLLRSFEFNLEDIKPGTALLSNEANEQSPGLINVIGGVLTSFGIEIDHEKMNSAVLQEPQLEFLPSLEATQKGAHKIKDSYKLNNKEMAISCAIASAFFIEQAKDDFSIESGLNTAIYGLIEGSKTMPPAMETVTKPLSKTTSEAKSKIKKWYQFW